MPYPTTPEVLRRRRLIVVGAVIAVLGVTLITYAALADRSAPSQAGHRVLESAPSATRTATTGDRAFELPALRPVRDPEAFARLVAQALFEWDTATIITRADQVEQLVAVADPTGESTSGLVSDLDNYLPTDDAWVDLAQYETRQWLSVESVRTPTLWAEAEAQAGPDGLLPGTTAFTIRGVRHRAGVWEGAAVSSSHDVAFTVFIVCAPSYPECHLLRLSMLDKPLE
jgi:hypothetical protein